MSKDGRMGALRHRLLIEQQVQTPDGHGGYLTTWQPLEENDRIFAAIYDLGARALREAGALANQTTHRIVTRYRQDVRQGMRLIGNGRVYVIDAVLDAENRKEYLEIAAHSE